jgi:ligand-binding sensor domain-containing protein
MLKMLNKGLLQGKTTVPKGTVTQVLLIRRAKVSWLAILGLLWCASAAGLNPDLSIKQLQHAAWGPRDGAPFGGVLGLAQTSDAYLWIMSPSGLYRFDGIAFERVELPRSPKISSVRMIRTYLKTL